jgi:uncharacterized protein (TIGR03437 family)
LTAVAAAPSGAWTYGVAGDSFYDLRSLPAVRAPSSSEPPLLLSSATPKNGALPGTTAADTHGEARRRVVLSDSGRYGMLSGGRVYQGWLSGPGDLTEVTVPSYRKDSNLAASDIALSADGRTLFAASAGDNTLWRIDLDDPAAAQSSALSFEPTRIALVSPQVGQAAGMLEQSSALRQTVAGGKSFTVQVRALNASGAPQSNVTVFASAFTPAAPKIDCFSGVTGANGIGTLYCTAGEVVAMTLVRLTVSDTSGRTAPSFEVTLTRPTATEGLVKTGGDFEVVPERFDFNLMVTASLNRVAQPNLTLTVSANPGRPTVTCPPQATTGPNGQATITCRSGVIGDPETSPNPPVDVQITVSDGQRTVVFSITIDPNKTLLEGLSKISGDGQRVAQGVDLPFPLVVRSVIDGVPLVNERLTVSVPAGQTMALTCPVFAFTDAEGFAFIRCRGGTVFGEQNVLVTVGGPGGSLVQFTVTVRASSSGIATELEIVTVGPINAAVGDVRPNAVRVVATDGSGQRVAGRPVYFRSDDGVTFNPPMAFTDGLGEASTAVTFGCSNRNRGTIEVGFSEDVTDDEIDFQLTVGTFARIDKLQGDNQSGVPGQTLSSAALLVQVGDMCGNPLAQQRLTWRVHPEARATFRNVVDTTNASGRSSVLVQLGSYGGPFTVTAQAGEVMATFNIDVTMEPSQLRRLSGNDQTVAPGSLAAQPLVVEVAGTNGFGVSAVDVTFSVTQGSATLTRPASKTDGLGLAFTNVQMGQNSGPVVVTASAIGRSVTFTLRPGAGGGPAAPLEGFVTGANYRPGWVPGSLGIVFGTGITGIEGDSGLVSAPQVPFPTTLAGVSVTVNGVAAPMIALAKSADGLEQINLQVPFGIQAPGTATVVITVNGDTLTVLNVPILRVQPGIFQQGSSQFAAALHGDDYSVVTPDNPARPGEIILLFLTGLGQTNPAVATNVPGPTPAPRTVSDPVVGLNNAGVENFGGYYAPTLVTAYQINFRVSQDAQTGNLEINVVVDGVSSQRALLPVRRP